MNEPEESTVYLDHAATTPLDPEVWESMEPWLRDRVGNAASRQHACGRRAAQAVEHAREQVAALLGADPREIVFTSGATEANNLALFGVAQARAYERAPRHVVTGATEHHAVLDPLRELEEREGFEVTPLPVDGEGRLSLERLDEALARGPRLLSLMHVNNELGTVHPLAEIGARCRERGVLFHTDAAQGAGKLPLDVNAARVDLLSLSAHKLHGPQGIGALFLRRKGPRVRCHPRLFGGGHERGLRSGTLNVAGIVGLGAAARRALEAGAAERGRIAGLRDEFESALRARLPGVAVNGGAAERVPGITSLAIEGVEAESLLARLEGVALSSSAACTSAQQQPSHVLRALGLDEARVAGSVRASFGRFSTREQVQLAVERLATAVERERESGPRSVCAS